MRAPTSPWFTPQEAADYARCHRCTVYEALYAEQQKQGSGLVGRQRVAPKGAWLIHIDDLDAWVTGKPAARRLRRTA